MGITNALHATKERKGLSRPALKKYMIGASIVPNPVFLNKMLKKMSDEGKVVPGADAGKRGSGCFKLSPEETLRLSQEETLRLLKVKNAALKKELKAKGIDVKKVLKKLKAKGSDDVKKVSKKKVSVTKKSNEVVKKNVKGGKVTKAVKSKSKPSSSKSKVSGLAKKKVLGAKPKKTLKTQGAGKVRKVAKQSKK